MNLSKSEEGAETITELYDQLILGHEAHLQPSKILERVFGFPRAQSAEEWIEEHKDVFERKKKCTKFPLPPKNH